MDESTFANDCRWAVAVSVLIATCSLHRYRGWKKLEGAELKLG
jgi:hypothetical protein